MILNYINFIVIFVLCFTTIQPSSSQIEDDPTKKNDDTAQTMIFNDGDIAETSDLDGNYDLVEEENILVMNAHNFNHVLHKNKFVLVEFYAPWCQHCKEFEPEYSVAGKILKETQNLTLGKVDVSKEESLRREFGIQSFPTIYLFEKGLKSEEYLGEKTADAIIAYMETRTDPNWKPPPTKIVQLTNYNFKKYLNKRPLALVLFYAEYCQHCQKMKPDYINAGKILYEYDIPLCQIDGVKYKEISDEFKVKGWPTLFVFRNGRAFEYKGGRDTSSIVSYMKDQLTSPTRECSTRQEIENRIQRYLPTIIGFFSGANSAFFREFFVVANYLRGEPLRFIHTFKKEIADEFNVEDEAIIVRKATVFGSNYEQAEQRITDKTKNGDEIAEFIRQNYRPLVGQRTKENQLLFYSVRPIVVIYYDVNFDHQFQIASEKIRRKVVEVAKDFPKVTFAVANEEEFGAELDAVKLGESGADVNVVWYDKNRIKYTMEPVDDFDESDLRNFVRKVLDKKLKPVWKSQPIPFKQTPPVFTVVADNYEDEIFKRSDSDVILYIYAPWCGHCKEFDKTYKTLAKKMTTKSLMFAKMDGTGNDLPPGLEIKGYPTIFFLKMNEKHEPVLYDGDRSISHFKAFIRKNQTKKKDDPQKKKKVLDEL